jgi:hypothetical protein
MEKRNIEHQLIPLKDLKNQLVIFKQFLLKLLNKKDMKEKDYTALLQQVGTKQTGVEWLVEKLSRVKRGSEIGHIIEHAKEMENQEKLEAFIEGYKQRAEKSELIFDNASRMFAIHLYKETFNK